MFFLIQKAFFFGYFYWSNFLDPKQSLRNFLTAFGNWYNHRRKQTNTMEKVTALFDRSSSNSDRSVQFLNVINNDTEWNNEIQVKYCALKRPFNLN